MFGRGQRGSKKTVTGVLGSVASKAGFGASNGAEDASSSRDPLYVVRPMLPPLEEVVPMLEEVWDSRIVTNGGPMSKRFELALQESLGIEHITLVANATLGLYTALQHLDLNGGDEVITSPFSFVATAHAILAAGLVPVFVDVDPSTRNLDPNLIEAAVTSRTRAILPVHCFGRACDTEMIESIALRHDLEVIYDAAHTFGVRFRGKSLLSRGRASVVSFHGTKIFNTLEGGAIISSDAETKRSMDRLINYGLEKGGGTLGMGLNAKLNEVSCAVGLASLNHVDSAIVQRGRISNFYKTQLEPIRGLLAAELDFPLQNNNYAYFPVEVTDEYPVSREEVLAALAKAGVYARKYFHPLLSDLDSVKKASRLAGAGLPHARGLSDRILCLPLFHDMTTDQAARVTEVFANPLPRG